MTLEQAKALVPDKDYVIYDFPNQIEILKFKELDLSDDKPLLILEREDRSIYCIPEFCHLLGEYRGCFDSTVLPPRVAEQSSISIPVFVCFNDSFFLSYKQHNHISIGWYNFVRNKWETISRDYNAINIKWCFKPDYLK